MLSKYFNPRPPCGGRRRRVSNHKEDTKYFNPRPPCGGRRDNAEYAGSDLDISIHAPRAGGDLASGAATKTAQYFNPRPPCGGRRYRAKVTVGKDIFQSTPPVRGATMERMAELEPSIISIHAPRAGGDSSAPARCFYRTDFNPRPPCGGRR